ncbi:MAG: carboxypeptidase-like regulatory domain-containing protein, partial [Bryobacteraceae bacterium]
MNKLRWFCAVCGLVCFSAAPSYGQAVNATVLGTVTDITGGAIPNAKVTATETDTGISRTSQTNESGNYTFPDLPPGRYSVTVEVAGFKKETR